MLFTRSSIATARWWALLFLTMLVAGVNVAQLTPAGAAEKEKECKAKDLDKDGEIEEGETQDCGGESYGTGGNDGADLPPAHEDANTHQWNGYHWTKPETDERKIIIRDSVVDTTSYDTKLGYVLSDWGQSSKFKFTRQSAETDTTTRLNCPMPTYYGRVRVCNHSDYTFSGAGIAKIVVNSENHIQRGTVRVKNSVGDSAQRPLLCQEVGHTLGLNHRSTTSSCMYQNASSAAASPDSHDYDQLVSQTHHHGNETDTGGALSDLNTGGGILDGCSSFLCSEVSAHGHVDSGHLDRVTHITPLRNGDRIIRIEWFVRVF